MKFSDLIDHASVLLQRAGRMTYRTLKREFDLSDEDLDILKDELIEARARAVDKDGKMLVWTGGEGNSESAKRGNGETASGVWAELVDQGVDLSAARSTPLLGPRPFGSW